MAVARGVELLDAKAPTFLDALPAGLQSGDEVGATLTLSLTSHLSPQP